MGEKLKLSYVTEPDNAHMDLNEICFHLFSRNKHQITHSNLVITTRSSQMFQPDLFDNIVRVRSGEPS